jgi:hypothetical protein
VGFALIAALWLTVASLRGEVIAFVATPAVAICGYVSRMVASQRSGAAVEWGLAGCGMVAEFVIYAGIAGAASLHAASQLGLAGESLNGSFVAGFGGAGSAGVWRLAIMAVVLAVLTPLVEACPHSAERAKLRLFGPPGDIRLPIACLTILLFGAQAGFLVVLVLGVAALSATVIDGLHQPRERAELRGYRGDGRIAVWIGRWAAGCRRRRCSSG